MTTAENGNQGPARGKGLAIGKYLLPLGLVAGTVAGANLMLVRGGGSTVAAWLLGGPLGGLTGLMAAFVLLVVINAVLRMARKR